MFISLLLFILGMALLVKGGGWLVNGASALARRFNISELAIGLTVVAFGTSLPEMVVNIFASMEGNTEIAIGNIVGSNICNILLILGIAGMVSPMIVQRSTVLKEIPFSLLASLVLIVMGSDALFDGNAVSVLSRGDGLVFIGFFIIFLYYTFGMSGLGSEGSLPHEASAVSPWKASLEVLLGLLTLIVGGKIVVSAAVNVATALGVSETLIGLTIVAVGTSLPELMTSVIAAKRGKADIAVGNVVGSNIFNIFWILGLSAVIRPLPLLPSGMTDLLVMVGATLILFFIIHNGGLHRRLLLWWKQDREYVIRRWEGAVMLVSYIGYVAFVVWRG
jgi:cation:H+ antiporter